MKISEFVKLAKEDLDLFQETADPDVDMEYEEFLAGFQEFQAIARETEGLSDESPTQPAAPAGPGSTFDPANPPRSIEIPGAASPTDTKGTTH
jgi:hypothetical protein